MKRILMKRLLALAVLPLLVSGALVDPSLADVREAGAQSKTGITATTPTDFGAVISAIQNSREITSDIKAISDASQMEIIRVSDIAAAEGMNALEDAVSRSRSDVDELRSAIAANDALSRKLQEEQVQVDKVVAAAEMDGRLIIYAR